MTAQEIVWREPPPARHPGNQGGPKTRSVKWFFDALRARPGEWALFKERVASGNGGLVTLIPAGHMSGTKPGECEATSRHFDGACDIYVRYVGGES